MPATAKSFRPASVALLLSLALPGASALAAAQSTQIYKSDSMEVNMLSDFEAGTRFYQSGNIDMAVTMFRQGAEKKDPQASFALGTHYFFGEGVDKDLAKAKELFEFAGAHGSMESLFFLSLMYERGDGVPVDATKAFDYALAAARGCVGVAQSSVARMYLEGKGVAKDSVEALAWLMLAAESDEDSKALLPAMRATLDEAQQQASVKRSAELRKKLSCPAPKSRQAG